MTPGSSKALRSAALARALARSATVATVAAVGVSLYTILVGAFRLQAGALRLSASEWFVPLAQAGWCALVAGWLFQRDAAIRGQWDAVPRAIQRWLTGSAEDVRRRLLWTAVLVGSIASVLLSWRIARQSIVVGSLEGGWIFGFLRPFTFAPIAVWCVASAIVAAGLRWMSDVTDREWRIVFAWILLGIGVQTLLRSLTPYTFGDMFASGVANSFYSATLQQSAASVLPDFLRLRDTWPIHAHSNMPGKLMLVYAFELISSRPDVLAWLIVVFSNLGGVLLYVFVRDLFEDRRVALFSLVLYLFVPGKLYFFPLMNTATPVIAFLWAVLVQRWLRTGRTVYAMAAGVWLFAIPFYEPLPLVMTLMFAALAAQALWRGDLRWRPFIAQSAALLVAFLATYAAVRVWIGFDLLDAFRHVAADGVAFNKIAERPYAPWLEQNLTDFFFATGTCQVLLVAAALGDGLYGSGRLRVFQRPIVALTLALMAMLLVLDVSGLNRGEIVRLWIFLECLFQIPAAYVCATLNSRRALALVLITTLLQAALGTATIAFVIP